MEQIVTSITPSDPGDRTDKTDVAAKAAADLVYISGLDAGIVRKSGKRGFLYYDETGQRVTDRAELDRIAALVIPPAYTKVVISTDPNTHLQAIGVDARGRKQYRYHPDWMEERGRAKFAKLPDFAAALPKIRERVDLDLRKRTPRLEKGLATVVWLLDNLFIRVGNATYAQENGSYGLTTLRNKHVKVDGTTVYFNFKGKSGKEWRLSHEDSRITRAIRTLQELPGQHLFQYLDENGDRHPVRSQDVNAYIREAAEAEFSSRQFRTWGATRMAAVALARLPAAESERQKVRDLNCVIDEVASRLVNTRAVCRSSYIHPQVFEAFERGDLPELLKQRPSRSASLQRWMEPDEIHVLRWLQKASHEAD